MKRPGPPGATLTQMVDADAEGSGNLINKICAKAAGFWGPTVGALKNNIVFFGCFFFHGKGDNTGPGHFECVVGGIFFVFGWSVRKSVFHLYAPNGS